MDVAVSTSDLNQGSMQKVCSWKTLQLCPPVARQANAGKLGGRKPEE